MNKRKSVFILSLTILMVMFSCSKEESEINNIETKDFAGGATSDSIILLKRGEDPYSLVNMLKAFDTLTSRGYSSPFRSLTPTGYYARVKFSTEEEFDILENDSNIVWYEYPMDYTVSRGGLYYGVPGNISPNEKYLYGVIPLDYTAPQNVLVQNIYPVFIPEDDVLYKTHEQFFDTLEAVSIELCSSGSSNSKASSRKWHPSADLTISDSLLGVLPLEGVRVRVKAHNGSKSDWAITDHNGHCTASKKFKGDVDYSICWYRHYFRIVKTIRNNNYTYSGPTSSSSWTKCISSSERELFNVAMVFKAAHLSFYNSNAWTITKPVKEGIFPRKQIIRYNHFMNNLEDGRVGAYKYTFSMIDFYGADIVIWKGAIAGLTGEGVFATTIHELAHASHRKYIGTNLSYVSHLISESWASCVTWTVMNKIYGAHYSTLGYYDGYQNWSCLDDNDLRRLYSPIFIDLMDTYNQWSDYQDGSDLVSNYTLTEIERLLPNVYDKTTLVSKLKSNLRHGATGPMIDSLMAPFVNCTGI